MATPAVLPDDTESWRGLAGCKGMDVDIFFPLGTPRMAAYDEAAKAAKMVCAWCPVKRECLEFAAATEGRSTANDDMGIYGGLTHSERRSYYRRTRDAARKARNG